jgi:hypothetical protein
MRRSPTEGDVDAASSLLEADRGHRVELRCQSLGVLTTLACVDPSSLAVALVETVVVVAREDMDVEVPDVLATGRFVVLPGRRAVARIGRTHGHGHLLREVPDRVPHLGGQTIEVLVVVARDHQRRPGVLWPPHRRDDGVGQLGHRDDVARLVVLGEEATLEPAEGAVISRRLVSPRHWTISEVGHLSHPNQNL